MNIPEYPVDEEREDPSIQRIVSNIVHSVGKSVANEYGVLVDINVQPFTPRQGCLGRLLRAPTQGGYFVIRAYACDDLATTVVGRFFVDLEGDREFSGIVSRDGIVEFNINNAQYYCIGEGKYIILD